MFQTVEKLFNKAVGTAESAWGNIGSNKYIQSALSHGGFEEMGGNLAKHQKTINDLKDYRSEYETLTNIKGPEGVDLSAAHTNAQTNIDEVNTLIADARADQIIGGVSDYFSMGQGLRGKWDLAKRLGSTAVALDTVHGVGNMLGGGGLMNDSSGNQDIIGLPGF